MPTPPNFDFESIRFLDGALTARIHDKDRDPNRVIERGKVAYVTVEWFLETTDSWVLEGTKWKLDLYAESIGPGPELDLATDTFDAMPPTSIMGPKLEWKHTLTIDTLNKVPQDGAFKLAVILTHLSETGLKTRLTGFVDIPMVQFYTHET